MGTSRYRKATLRPGETKYNGRAAKLAKFDPAALDDYVAACFDADEANAATNKRMGTSVDRPSYLRRLNRMAVTVHAKSLLHLLVWYELECKGPHNARKWQERLAKLFADDVAVKYGKAFAHLEALWEMNQEKGAISVGAHARCIGITEKTVYLHLSDFALQMRQEYCARWLVFMYSLHKELQARPELVLLPAEREHSTKTQSV